MTTFLIKKYFFALILLFNTVVLADDKEIYERFAQGTVLIRNKNYEQAAPIFSNLIEKYPTFPEPYNNLAFIYAAQGDYMKAQDILQAAFKNNPSYALVYDNLNMIYAEIAQGIYEKAINIQNTSREPLKKLYLIDHIFDKTEHKTIVQNNINAPSLPIDKASSVYASLPKYINFTALFLTGVSIGLIIKDIWLFLVKIAVKINRKPKALKMVDFSYFFGNLREELR